MARNSHHYDRRRPRQDELIARVAAGETVRAVCAEPHMPHEGSVCRWALSEPWFAEALANARRRATARRSYDFDDAKAQAFLARLRAGEAIRALQRDASMPGRRTLRYWRATQGEFASEVFRLVGFHRAERGRRQLRSEPRDWDEAVADRVLLMIGRGHSGKRLGEVDPALPGYRVIRRWRRERPEFDAEVRVTQRMGRLARGWARRRAVLEPLLNGIVRGGSLNSLSGKNGLPCRATLYAWVRRDPAFAREVAQACDDREDWYTDQMQIIADEAGPISVADARRRVAPLSRRLGQLRGRPGKRWLG